MEGKYNYAANLSCMDKNEFYYRIRSVAEHAAALLYPQAQSCCFCGISIKTGTGVHGVCLDCYRRWIQERNANKPCPRCGFFTEGVTCQGPCQDGLADLAFIMAAAPHSGIYRQAIQAFKYNGQTHLAEPLGYLMSEAMHNVFNQIKKPWLVPVPLHTAKEKQRGFNQSALLANWISLNYGLKVKHLLLRTRQGSVQAGLQKGERKANLVQAYSLQSGVRLDPGQPLLLVDDVVTTGATLLACARVLRRYSKAEIAAICFTAGTESQNRPGIDVQRKDMFFL
jgi:ComF family protein